MFGASLGAALGAGVQGYSQGVKDTQKYNQSAETHADRRKLMAQQIKNAGAIADINTSKAVTQKEIEDIHTTSVNNFKKGQTQTMFNNLYRDWANDSFPNVEGMNTIMKDLPELAEMIGTSKFREFNASPNSRDLVEAAKMVGVPLDDEEGMKSVKKFAEEGMIMFGDDGRALDLQGIAAAVNSQAYLPKSDQLKVQQKALGILPSKSSGGGMQGPFGKYVSDRVQMSPNLQKEYANNPDVVVKKLQKDYNEQEKQSQIYAAKQAISSEQMNELPQKDLNHAVRTVQGKESTPHKDTRKPFQVMKDTANRFGLNTEKPLLDQISKLPTVQQAELKSTASDYVKSIGRQVDPAIVTKTLNTINSMDFTADDIDEEIKAGAGLADQVYNSVAKFVTVPSGAEFQKVYKKVFNNLLQTSNKGHISDAELDNLKDAYSNLSADQRLVLRDFKDMVYAVGDNLRRLDSEAPIAGQILYGKQLKAFDEIDSMLQGLLDGNNGSASVAGMDFKGAE